MNQPIVLTVIARDKPGIVQRVSGVLKEHGGAWHRSSMSQLAGRFAGILQGVVPKDRLDDCLAAFEALDGEGLHVVVRLGDATPETAAGKDYRLELVGNDRPGIMADITSVLGRFGVNVLSLETEVESASMAGGELFRAWANLRLPVDTEVAELEAALEELANDLMVEIHLEA